MLAILTAILAFYRFRTASVAADASADVTRLMAQGELLERLAVRLCWAALVLLVVGIVTMWLATANVNAYTSLAVALAAHGDLETSWLVSKAVADLSFWVTVDEAASWTVIVGLIL